MHKPFVHNRITCTSDINEFYVHTCLIIFTNFKERKKMSCPNSPFARSISANPTDE